MTNHKKDQIISELASQKLELILNGINICDTIALLRFKEKNKRPPEAGKLWSWVADGISACHSFIEYLRNKGVLISKGRVAEDTYFKNLYDKAISQSAKNLQNFEEYPTHEIINHPDCIPALIKFYIEVRDEPQKHDPAAIMVMDHRVADFLTSAGQVSMFANMFGSWLMINRGLEGREASESGTKGRKQLAIEQYYKLENRSKLKKEQMRKEIAQNLFDHKNVHWRGKPLSDRTIQRYLKGIM